MNILITGCAGFIGYSLATKLLKKNNYFIYGIDNLNKFYSVKLKKKRLSLLARKKNFKFFKVDISNKKKIENIFNQNKFDIIFNFAAQAGVRYVLSNPEKFIKSNILGFHNLLDVSKKHKIKTFFYASSSSVYGDKNNYPVSEQSTLNPKNIYGISKKFNEEYINLNFNQKTKYIGLRFFTVYGEWGRPDMLIFKFLKCANQNKTFFLNNKGNHWRDFTYIDDVTKICEKLITKKFKKNKIFNICSNKPIHIASIIEYLSKKANYSKIVNIGNNNFEVLKTHGKNLEIKKFTNFKKFQNFFSKIDKVIKWYWDYKKIL